MDKEDMRLSLNKFLKMYFDASKEVYSEINFDRITKIQFRYLKAIRELEKTTLTQLAEHCKISKPSMNEVIVKFEKSGLIEKVKCHEDKRVSWITLTDMGHTLSTTNLLESKRAVEKIYDRLTLDEINTLQAIFDKFEVKEK
jgi:DNA-binding MarR family transcriptional regulator